MIITAEILLKVAPRAKKSIVQGLAIYLPDAMEKYQINTALRIKHFLGQASHETDGFATLNEYASGKAYEGRRDLGNTVAGYGVKYKGRGIFQLTGFANYKVFGSKLGVDLVNHPELAADPQWAVLTACEYWASRKLNTYADADDIRTITKKINGGLNGFDDRQVRTANAAKAMPDILKKVATVAVVAKVEVAKVEVVKVSAIDPLASPAAAVEAPAKHGWFW